MEEGKYEGTLSSELFISHISKHLGKGLDCSDLCVCSNFTDVLAS